MEQSNYEKLLKALVKTGVCKTGKRYLKGSGKDFGTFIKVMKGWPEYLYEHADKSLPLLRRFIKEEDAKEMIKEGVFIDAKGAHIIESRMSPIFVIGDSSVCLRVKDYNNVKIYAFNNSKVTIERGQNCFVDVEGWNNAHIDSRSHKIVVYLYDKSTVEGDAKVSQKEYERGNIFNGKEIPKTYRNESK